MMNAILSALVTIIVFIVIPVYAPSLLPPQYADLLIKSGFNFSEFAKELAVIGFAIAVLTLVKGFVRTSNPLYLLASIASSGIMLAFTLFTLSLGRMEDINNLGITTVTMNIKGGTNTLVLDFRFFVQLAILTVGLKIRIPNSINPVFKIILEDYRETRQSCITFLKLSDPNRYNLISRFPNHFVGL
jgi:hypothetical protein